MYIKLFKVWETDVQFRQLLGFVSVNKYGRKKLPDWFKSKTVAKCSAGLKNRNKSGHTLSHGWVTVVDEEVRLCYFIQWKQRKIVVFFSVVTKGTSKSTKINRYISIFTVSYCFFFTFIRYIIGNLDILLKYSYTGEFSLPKICSARKKIDYWLKLSFFLKIQNTIPLLL